MRLSSPFDSDRTPNEKKVLICRSRRIAPGPTGPTTIPSREGVKPGCPSCSAGSVELRALVCSCKQKKQKKKKKKAEVAGRCLWVFTLDRVLSKEICVAARYAAPQARTGLKSIALVLHPLTNERLPTSAQFTGISNKTRGRQNNQNIDARLVFFFL